MYSTNYKEAKMRKLKEKRRRRGGEEERRRAKNGQKAKI